MATDKNWQVLYPKKIAKQIRNLPKDIMPAFQLLVSDLHEKGPEQPHWQNYGRLVGSKGLYHCHINKGHPRYVVVWKNEDRNIKIIEVKYAGTHEGVDYGRIR